MDINKRKDVERMRIEGIISKKITKLHKTNEIRDKRIVLFGCTIWSNYLVSQLKKYRYEILAFIDNSPKKIGGNCVGIEVHSPNWLLSLNKEALKILILCASWKDMSRQLDSMGYVNNKDYIIIRLGKESVKDHDYKLMFIKNSIKLYRGYKIYRRLKREYGKECKIFVLPYDSIGDVYVTSLYFFGYIKREKIFKYLFVVIGKIAQKTALALNFDNVKLVTVDEGFLLLYAYQFLNLHDVKSVLYYGSSVKKYIDSKIITEKTIPNFCEMIKYDVYNMNGIDDIVVPKFHTNVMYINDFFANNKLKIGKTVILSPYAGSLDSNIPEEFWNKLTLMLKDLGYTVCTNSSGDNEPAIANTSPVFFALKDALPILNKAGYFIGYRSGLCDFISSSSCKKVVFYSQNTRANNIEFFSLNKMGLCSDANEIVFDVSKSDLIIESIIKYFKKHESEKLT